MNNIVGTDCKSALSGVGNFSLQSNTATILGTQLASQYTVSYHLSQNDADINTNPLATSYSNISNPQTIYIRIENNQNTSCFTTTNFQIGLYKMPIAHQPQNLFLCDDDTNNGKEEFDLASQNSVVLDTQLATDFSISYYETQADANAGTNQLSSSYINITNPQIIYVRIANIQDGSCYDTTSFVLKVEEKPVLSLNDTYSICQGNSITVTAPAGFDTYLWSNGDVTPSTVYATSGNYWLTVTKDYGNIICDATKNIVVYNSNVATITQIETHDWTNNQNSITVHVTGDGIYEYSIDGIHYQDSEVFYGLQSGYYDVYVNDKKGCGVAIDEVFLLMYPQFFTPNGDGINDTWQIEFSNIEPNMQLTLFDRYGKLIRNFTGLDFGWDGTFNGKLLPADDYWFVVKRQNGKEFKGHFVMKR